MLFVINSQARPAQAAHTVTLLETYGAEHIEVWLPHATETSAYRAALTGTSAVLRLGGGSRSLADARRDTMLAHPGEPLVFVADDLTEISRTTESGKRSKEVEPGELPGLLEPVFTAAKKAGAAMWGTGELATGAPPAVGQFLVRPNLWGITTADPMPYVAVEDTAEWVERSARAVEHDGAVLVWQQLAATATGDKAPRTVAWDAAVARVESRWPGTMAPKPMPKPAKKAPAKRVRKAASK